MLDLILLKYVGLIRYWSTAAAGHQRDDGEAGQKPAFVSGLRVTDEETMEIAEMVLAGKVNKEIVSLISKYGARPLGCRARTGICSLFGRRSWWGG